LETICLKCLHKEPARRYRSAGELAEDLRRWLAGEQIMARPVGPLERAIKWARRRPRAAIRLGMSLAAVVGLVAWSVVALAQSQRASDALQGQLDAQVEAVLSADPRAVPHILATLRTHREDVQLLFRRVWDELDTPANRKRRMRAGVVLV